jgi:hypothetical protein
VKVADRTTFHIGIGRPSEAEPSIGYSGAMPPRMRTVTALADIEPGQSVVVDKQRNEARPIEMSAGKAGDGQLLATALEAIKSGHAGIVEELPDSEPST